MPPTSRNDVRINDVIYDFITIEIVDPCLHHLTKFYSIQDANERIIRKGSFTGDKVQLRVSHMTEGKYSFQIVFGENNSISIPFKKMAPTFSEMSVVIK
jgi:hypothetical protein